MYQKLMVFEFLIINFPAKPAQLAQCKEEQRPLAFLTWRLWRLKQRPDLDSAAQITPDIDFGCTWMTENSHDRKTRIRGNRKINILRNFFLKNYHL